MNKKYIPIERLRRLHESINFLDNYKPTEGEIHHIGNNINDIDVKNTKLLQELGELNIRKEKIINSLLSK